MPLVNEREKSKQTHRRVKKSTMNRGRLTTIQHIGCLFCKHIGAVTTQRRKGKDSCRSPLSPRVCFCLDIWVQEPLCRHFLKFCLGGGGWARTWHLSSLHSKPFCSRLWFCSCYLWYRFSILSSACLDKNKSTKNLDKCRRKKKKKSGLLFPSPSVCVFSKWMAKLV